MHAGRAVLLGLIQGFTEFLPISSSGHLVLAQSLLGGRAAEESSLLFELVLHLGTLLAVVIAFRRDLARLLGESIRWARSGFRLEGRADRRFLVLLLLTLVPMLPVLPLRSRLVPLFESPLFVGSALLVTALLLALSDRVPKGRKTAATARWRDALLVGCAQAVAVLPGISRSGAALCTGLLVGFSREFAVRFAFLMSLPVVLGANLLELGDALAHSAAGIDPALYLLGAAAAFVSGLVSIGLVRLLVRRGALRAFAIYCAALGGAAVLASLLGYI